MLIPDSNTTDYTPCPAGSYPAKCVSLIDLGSQTSTFEAETKSARKVLVSFEITDPETRRTDGTPFVVSKRFTLSKHEKAALRGFLTAWRGRDFTPEEIKRFDLRAVLGADCLMSLIHTTKDGKTFTNISGAMRLPRGMTAPAGEMPLQHFDLTDPDWQVYAALGSRLQAQIAESPEFIALPNKPRTVALGAAPAATAAAPRPATAPQTPAQAMPEPPPGYDFAPLDAADADLIPF